MFLAPPQVMVPQEEGEHTQPQFSETLSLFFPL